MNDPCFHSLVQGASLYLYIGSHLAPEKYFYLFNTQIVW